MKTVCYFAGVLILAPLAVARAQEPQNKPAETLAPLENEPPAASQPEAAAKPEPPPFFRLDYSGDFLTAPAMTGDWGGTRSELAKKGISFNLEIASYGMGNAYGGANTSHAFQHSGTADYSLEFDTGRMGLWPGALIKVRGETQYGRSINNDAGAISTPNFDALLPSPGDPGVTTLTEYWIMQFVSEKLGFIAGQVDLTGLPGQNEFTSGRYDGFMNTSFWQPPVVFTSVPYSAMTFGAVYFPTKWFDGATLIVDSYGTPSFSGFDSAFHSPQAVSLVQALNFHIKPFGQPGTQRFTFSYSNRERYAIGDLDRLLLADLVSPSFDRLGLVRSIRKGRLLNLRNLVLRQVGGKYLEPSRQSDNGAFWYDFDQYLYTDPQDPKQGFGIFGKFGWAPGERSPVEEYYSFGVGGKGLIPKRPRDRYGIGYYLLNMSDDLPGALNANTEQGVELFYNIEVTPWLHITPDVQCIINPGGNTGPDGNDPAIVYGVRAHIKF